MERLFDILFSVLALLLLIPLFLPTIIILKLTGEGEIFFYQERIGLNGKPFMLYKFATMLKDSPNMEMGTITVKGDPRILPFGKLLRKTKINELPQLINIIIGDMSVIGPRPLTVQTFNAYPQTLRDTIINVRPGLSGIGSIIFRNEEEIMSGDFSSIEFYNSIIAPYKGALEEWFLSNRSLSTYFRAIFVTAYTVIFPTSNLAWRIFKTLPEPPIELRLALHFPEN